ncbi:unnamed protein product [Xylocopa violacea]|uniref:YDG domain-containing protein n=1 Tax=Xylocopa violacea TaxID=135666 RepID=A0ABP1NMQ1_XYLVO
MAKNDSSMNFCANNVHENEKMLQESCYKNQVDIKSKEELEKLFNKLNYICQTKSAEEETQLNSSWCNKNVTSYTYGSISGFPSGSWWGIRMDCSRDRVHDPFDENIQNGPFGVTSICTASINLNEDVDFGDALTLTGQKYLDGKLDKDPLVKNYENQIPIRVIRSYNLFNEFAPKTGYRYDGLYIVTNVWIGINSDTTKHYKFALLRLNNQEPPSWNTKPAPSTTSSSTSTLHSICQAPLQNNLKTPAPNSYEFKKYSHGSSESTIQKGKHEMLSGCSHSLNAENKKPNEKEKVTSESAIVTRHVFKKVNTNTECTSNAPNASIMSENKSLTHIGNQGSKTHNTNISIRTGLYNSSHNTEHDNKKNTSSPFCRTAKSLNVLKANQHTESWNFLNKDKNRNLDGKVQTVTSIECPTRIDYTTSNAVKDSLKVKFAKDINIETNCPNSNDTSSNSGSRLECNYKEIINDIKDVCTITANSSDTTTNMLQMTNCMYKNEIPTHKIIPKEEQELKSLTPDSLDSLTPDQILHLIKNRDHPLSKLLMGNMIGLTSEQSVALRTKDTITESEIKDKIITQKNSTEGLRDKTNFEVVSDDLSVSRCYKFRRRKRLSRKTMNKPEMIKCNKLHNEKLKSGSAQTLDILEYSRKSMRKTNICKDVRNKSVKQNHVQKRESNHLRDSTKSIKENVGNKRKGRLHLETVGTINSSIKKHVNKKQRREITNLLIDAKIGPKIRGPRYRRLRCINKAYAKQSYEHYDTAICTLDKCKVSSQRPTFRNRNKLTKITTCKRTNSKQGRNVNRSETLTLKHNKICRNVTVSKKISNDHITKRILNNNNNNDNRNVNNNIINNDNNENDNNSKSKFMENGVKKMENGDVTVIKNRKRKLMPTAYKELKSSKIEKLNNDDENEVSKPCKIDAVTQCSLIKEPLTRNLKLSNLVQNNVRNEPHIFIKIEYGDFKDMKSEICETTKSDNDNKSSSTSRFDKKYIPCTKTVYNIQHPKNALLNNSILNTREENKVSSKRVSAFVPVNIPDNDVKIARLRSIGFKPINFSNKDEDIHEQEKRNKVVKRNVDEKYNEYTNEENDIVVYMDDELQYQDIENEDKSSLSIRRKTSNSMMHAVKEERLNKMILEKGSCSNLLLEQELESPWHGWKKVVTSKDTYWTGW